MVCGGTAYQSSFRTGMSPEQESTLQPQQDTVAESTLAATRPRAVADGLELRVSWLRDGEAPEGSSQSFRLTANHWERLEIPLPAAWRGEELRLEPACRFGMIEVVGARVVSGVMRETLWEKLGRNLTTGVRPSAGLLVLSNQFRLRLLCTGNDARLSLPGLKLPESEMPRVLELGLRVRTDLAAIGHTLQEWVEDADARRRETQEQLAAAEGARAAGEKLAATLLAEIEMARAHGDQRAAALTAEIGSLRAEIGSLRDGQRKERQTFEYTLAANRQALAKLHAELAEARRSGEEQLGRVRSMQQSLSWRMTLPWRIVGRALSGRKPAGRHPAKP